MFYRSDIIKSFSNSRTKNKQITKLIGLVILKFNLYI